jgi:hypothetical protein
MTRALDQRGRHSIQDDQEQCSQSERVMTSGYIHMYARTCMLLMNVVVKKYN